MDDLSSSEVRFLDALAQETAGGSSLEHEPENAPFVLRGTFLRNLILGKLVEVPPKGIDIGSYPLDAGMK